MRKISKDENGFVNAFIMNPYGISLIVIVIAFIIIAMTAATPGLALIGLIVCILGAGGIITMVVPKIGTITISAGIFLILIGYGYIL